MSGVPGRIWGVNVPVNTRVFLLQVLKSFVQGIMLLFEISSHGSEGAATVRVYVLDVPEEGSVSFQRHLGGLSGLLDDWLQIHSTAPQTSNDEDIPLGDGLGGAMPDSVRAEEITAAVSESFASS